MQSLRRIHIKRISTYANDHPGVLTDISLQQIQDICAYLELTYTSLPYLDGVENSLHNFPVASLLCKHYGCIPIPTYKTEFDEQIDLFENWIEHYRNPSFTFKSCRKLGSKEIELSVVDVMINNAKSPSNLNLKTLDILQMIKQGKSLPVEWDLETIYCEKFTNFIADWSSFESSGLLRLT